MGEVFRKELKKGSACFDVKRCAKCGEAVFIDKLTTTGDGGLLCVPCSKK